MSKRGQSIDPIKLDQNMSLRPSTEEALRWVSPFESPVQIAGFAWFDQEQLYRRLPMSAGDIVRPAVHQLANCTAGGQIRFRTNSSRLVVRVKLAGPANMYHMPATGQCGFDCYLGEPGQQHFYSITKFDHTKEEFEAELFDWQKKLEFNVTLNFPLYQGVEEVWIGIDADADIGAPPQYATDQPIVVYGTSITQGGCASRPGMAFTNILSRSIPLEFINLGFSGNGKGEPEVARIVAEIENPT